jgi:hypothetical protein
MKQPKVLFLLVGFTILALLAAAADANSQLATSQAPQGDAPLPIAQNLEIVKHWGGSVRALVFHGSYAYLSVGTELQVHSLADPAAPVWLRSLFLNTAINQLYASGNYLYVGHNGQLTIMDISNPESPVWTGSLYVPGSINSIAVSPNYAFLAMSPGLAIVDLSDPSDPQLVYFAYDDYYLWKVLVIDHYVYFTRHSKLYVLDISNPAAPVEVHSQHIERNVMVLVGNYLYVSADPTLILDVTDPTAPQEVGTTIYAGDDAQVLDGDYLYLFTDLHLTVLNVANPVEPVWLGDYEFTEEIDAFQVQNGYIYTMQGDDSYWWLVTFDATIPQSPVEVSSHLVSSKGMEEGKVFVDGYLYFGKNSGPYFLEPEVRIYDISEPLTPLFLSSYYYGNTGWLARSWDFAVQDNFAYNVSESCINVCDSTFLVVDVSNPLTLTATSIEDPGILNQLKISGHHLFAEVESGVSETVFAVYDIIDPVNPYLLHYFHYTWPIEATDIVSVGDYLYITTSTNPGGTLEVVDFSNPAEPTIVGSYQTAQLLTSVNVVGSYLYV